jgi:hypothetical protein
MGKRLGYTGFEVLIAGLIIAAICGIALPHNPTVIALLIIPSAIRFTQNLYHKNDTFLGSSHNAVSRRLCIRSTNDTEQWCNSRQYAQLYSRTDGACCNHNGNESSLYY